MPAVPSPRPAPRGAVDSPMPRLLLTVEEAARCIGIGRSLMYELIAAGDLATVQIGRLRRVRPEDLSGFVSGLDRASSSSRAGQSDVVVGPVSEDDHAATR